VDRDRQAELGRGLEDSEVARLTIGPLGAAAEHDLDETGVLACPTDLPRGLVRVLSRADDRPAQAHIALEPALPDPVVVRPGERGRAVRARHQRDEDRVVGVQDSEAGSARIEQLPLDGLDIRSGGPPTAARSCRYHEDGWLHE